MKFLIIILFYTSVIAQTFEEKLRQHITSSFPQYENIEVTLNRNFSSDEKILIDETRPINLGRGIAFIPVIAAKGLKTSKSILSVKIKLIQKVYVALNDFEKHTRLSNEAFILKSLDVTNINGKPVISDALFNKYRTKSFIKKGEILFEEKIEKIPLICVGDKVDAEVRAGNVIVKTETVARENGSFGDVIELVSTGNKLIKARVVDANKVIVE